MFSNLKRFRDLVIIAFLHLITLVIDFIRIGLAYTDWFLVKVTLFFYQKEMNIVKFQLEDSNQLNKNKRNKMHIKKSIAQVFSVLFVLLLAQSCMPAADTNANYWGAGFPSSTTETHTKTTIVSPPSYSAVNMPSASVVQSAPMVQQPMMYQAQQANACYPQYQYAPQVQVPQYALIQPQSIVQNVPVKVQAVNSDHCVAE